MVRAGLFDDLAWIKVSFPSLVLVFHGGLDEVTQFFQQKRPSLANWAR